MDKKITGNKRRSFMQENRFRNETWLAYESMMQFITSRLRSAEVFVALRSVWEGWGMSIECNISKSGPKRPENRVYFGIFGSAIPHECVCLASVFQLYS